MASITNKGRKWELGNSIWILWTLVPFGFTNFIAFYYIGIRMKQWKWILAAFIYTIPFIGAMVAPDSVPDGHWMEDVIYSTLLTLWVISIFHAIKARSEYLIRLETWLDSGLREKEFSRIRSEVSKEYGIQETTPSFPTKTISHNVASTERININTATEKEIASIQGIGAIFAQKVVAARNEAGGFQSLDHFIDKLQIKPHVRMKLENRITFDMENQSVSSPEQPKTQGRVIDY
ncbi:ComEA family DNA-binding protein [Sutcliffiella horikoshii]|uniref:ComEA family DNA-binding protein n=1 Tax=Sutcliffiella horikoshii TaxID=79883 RepID=UPI001CFC7990|nr:helix-hairpin-helix domain-containing protein [Sutcliffiella horikoshii]